MRRFRIGLIAIMVGLAGQAYAQNLKVNKDNSVIAVIVNKTGPLKAMGHHHFIFASQYEVTTPFNPSTGSGSVTFDHQELINDLYEVTSLYNDDIVAKGLVDENFKPLSAEDRSTIRGHMLAEDQLGEGRINVRLISLGEATAELELTIRGARVIREIEARFEQNGDTAMLSLNGPFNFSDFGIKPYSAFGGLLSNKDQFYIYGRFELN